MLSLAVGQTQEAQATSPGLNGKIVFVSNREGRDEIFTMNPDGTNQTRLTTTADLESGVDSHPSWSSDGTKIVFMSTRDGQSEIYTMNADGSNQTRLTNDPGGHSNPAWSPDSTKVVFNSDRDSVNDIFVMDADGSNVTNITNSSSNDASPSWSPDGSSIVFRNNTDNTGITTINPDGTGRSDVVSYGLGGGTGPRWSPGGSKIVFWVNDGSVQNRQVYTVKPDGTELTAITDSDPNNNHPVFSPDGSKIAFKSNRDGGNDQIYVMNHDGTNQQRITNNEFSQHAPSWQPLTIPPTTLDSSRTFEVAADGSVTIDTVANHTDAYGNIDPASVAITVKPQQGTTDINSENGEITYIVANPNPTFSTLKTWAFSLLGVNSVLAQSNQDSLTYQICSDQHPELCSTETVTLNLADNHPGLPDTGANYTSVLTLGLLVAVALVAGVVARGRFAGKSPQVTRV